MLVQYWDAVFAFPVGSRVRSLNKHMQFGTGEVRGHSLCDSTGERHEQRVDVKWDLMPGLYREKLDEIEPG